MTGKSFLIAAFSCCVLIAATMQIRADDGAEVAFFESQVLPLLKSRCYSCHSHESGKSKGGLVVDSKGGLITGGDSGTAIVPGNPDKSLLIAAVRRGDGVSPMPPDNGLSAAEVALLEQWVRRGATDPRKGQASTDPFADILKRAQTHWSLQPIVKPTVPSTTTTAQSAHPIDAFIAAKRGEHGLQGAREAAPRDLIRRLTFDLIGLPPTFEQVARFKKAFAANADDAVSNLVDELLASPHYGERWGRHWLDLARYAEVSGGASNRARDTRLLNAFTYRDYVIRAFNEDKPYDQFVIQQLAADQCQLKNPRDLAALGFLPIGSQEGSPPEVRAERIDTIGKVFLGLSLGCARCHDHKFDPVSTADFYALDGVFISTQEIGVPRFKDSFGDFESCPIIAEVSDSQSKASREAAIAHARQALRDYEQELWGPTEADWRKRTPEVWRVLAMELSEFGPLGEKDYLRKHDIPWVLVKAWHDWLDLPAKQNRRSKHSVFGPWLELSKLKADEFSTEANNLLAKYGSDKSINQSVLAALQSRPLRSKSDVAAAYADLFMAVDAEWQQDPTRSALPDADREAIRQSLYGEGAPTVRDPARWRNHFGNVADTNRNRLLAKLNDVAFAHAASPERAMVLRDRGPQDAHILIRGEADQRGDRVPRGFLTILGREGRRLEFPADSSGRLELAQAIVDRANPLTARVLVNRVWAQHFGRSLVDAADDFGLQTPEPEHHALLDWLAVTFVQDGCSLKKLHRRMLLSHTYRQSAVDHADYTAATAIDPENSLFWRGQMRRLDFESLRDAVLASCGTLDPTIYGRSVNLIEDPTTTRRTVYAWIDRPTQSLLSTFDVPDNSVTASDRHESTSSSQALYLMNAPFVDHHAQRLLQGNAFRDSSSATHRITWLFQRLLQREPTQQEVVKLQEFLAEQQFAERAWRRIVQTLVMCNEFAHVL